VSFASTHILIIYGLLYDTAKDRIYEITYRNTRQNVCTPL